MEEITPNSSIKSKLIKFKKKIFRPWETFKKKASERKKLVVMVIIIGIGALGLLVFSTFQFLLKFGFIEQNPFSTKEQPYVSPTPVPTQESYTQGQSLVLKRGEEVVGDFDNKKTLRWQNYLFFGNDSYDQRGLKLFSHNLDTGETKLLYEEENSSILLSDLQVINETLFFSIGGYMGPIAKVATYWLDLPPEGEPQKLADSRNAKIELKNGRYWLIGGEGDACWCLTDYSLVDVVNKKATFLVTSHEGCTEGEEYLGLDKKDRIILAHHTSGWRTPESEPGVYTYVSALRLSDLEKEGIIAEQEMPEGINIAKYSEEKDQLLLISRSVYLFDLASNSLNKVVDLPDDWPLMRFVSWEGNTLCLRNAEAIVSQQKYYEINLAQKQTIKESETCQPEPSPSPFPYRGFDEEGYFRRQIERLTEELNLPPNYKFVIEEKEQ